MNILITCKMAAGTFEAKIKPIADLNIVKNIFVLRKQAIGNINKTKFIILPKVCNLKFFNLILTPIIIAYLCNKKNIDLVIGYHFIPHGIFSYLGTRISRTPYIFGQTGGYVQKLYLKSMIYKWLVTKVIENAEFINVPGSISKQFWINNSFDSNRINQLHSTIDTNLFVPSKCNKEYDFIFLGQLIKRKQILSIIQGFQKVLEYKADASFVIVGSGAYSDNLKEYVRKAKLGKNIHFVGFQKNTWDWYNKAKIFVMNSTCEGLPTALMQAMSCELVCISNNIDNIPDLLTKDTGFIFNFGDNKKMDEYMLKAYTEYDELTEIRKNSRKHILAYHSYNSASKKWDRLLRNIS